MALSKDLLRYEDIRIVLEAVKREGSQLSYTMESEGLAKNMLQRMNQFRKLVHEQMAESTGNAFIIAPFDGMHFAREGKVIKISFMAPIRGKLTRADGSFVEFSDIPTHASDDLLETINELNLELDNG